MLQLLPFVLRELLLDAPALALEGLAQVLLLPLAALPELLDGERREFLGPRLELGQEFVDVPARPLQAVPLDHLAGHVAVGIDQRPIQKIERPRLRLSRVRLERVCALGRLDPARGERHQFLVQALRPLSIEREPAQQDHPRDRVGGLGEAGPREVMVDKALGAETGQKPLRYALLKVQVDGVFGEHARVLEDDRPDGRFPAPVGELLVLLARRPQRIQGGGPAWVGFRASVEWRKGIYGAALIIGRSP